MATRGNIKRLIFRFAVLTSAAFSSLLPPPCFAAPIDEETDCLKLGADEGLAQFFALFEAAIADVYRRAGYCAISVPLSPKRIEQMVSTGTLDGDWARVKGYAEMFGQDLVAVPYPLFQVEAVMLSLVNSPFTGSPEDLNGRRVGFEAGFRWLEKNLPKVGAIPLEVPADVPIKDLLERGRFEVFATDGVRGKFIENKFAAADAQVRVHSWKKSAFYHFVHRRHADKLGRLQKAFIEAVASGTMDQVFALPGLSRIEPDN